MEKSSAASKIIAGGIAGASETLVTYPAEFIKTRRQLPQYSGAGTSSLAIIRSTYNTSGLAGFYSGCQALIVSNAFKAGIRFLSFETSRDYFEKALHTSPGTHNPWITVLSGLTAGITESVLVVTPGEALKTKMIHDAASAGRSASRGMMQTTATIVRDNGPLALWRGLGPVLCKQGTNSAVRFTTFGMSQDFVNQRWPALKHSSGVTLLLGAISGVVTVYASMPFDNVKTRMQSYGGGYTGMWDCAGRILREDGVAAFWRGTTPRLVRLTLSSAITFTVYERVMRAITEPRMLETMV